MVTVQVTVVEERAVVDVVLFSKMVPLTISAASTTAEPGSSKTGRGDPPFDEYQ